MASQPPEQLEPRRAKSSSERERQFILQLEQSVGELRRAVAEKEFLKGVWEAKYLRSRHTKYGSLTRMTEEYYSILRYGVRVADGSCGDNTRSKDTTQPTEFLSRVTHPDAILGDVVGPENMIDQWARYTAAHGYFETEIYDVEIVGPDDSPLVFARLLMHTRFTRKTFEELFPHELHNERLIQFLIGKQITYPGTTVIQFSPEMQIVSQVVHLNFITGFLTAGARIHEVNHMMEGVLISSTCTIKAPPPRDVKPHEECSTMCDR